MLRLSLQKILASLSRQILKKYKPKIIGITGSVGKTSAKEAVFAVVSQKFRSYRAAKNFNDELGLPLAIIGYNDNPQKNPLLWLRVFFRAIRLILLRTKFPEILILEYGIDKPGDMDHLVSIAKADIAIITSISISHYQFFENADAIENEKGKLAEALDSDGILIVNADNDKAFAQKQKTKAQTISYGMTDIANVKASLKVEHADTFGETIFSVKTPSREFEAHTSGIGQTHVSAGLAGVAVAEALKIETDLVVKGLLDYKPSPGRLNIISGIKHSVLIDDTYNASPDSMKEALAVFERLPSSQKIAVLGTMRELGSLTEQAHVEIGQLVARINPDYLITVGDGGRTIADTAIEAGMTPERALRFESSDEAKKVVQDLMAPESLVLIKGSQYVRMEKITKEIMAEPMRAKELLCRQYGTWLNT